MIFNPAHIFGRNLMGNFKICKAQFEAKGESSYPYKLRFGFQLKVSYPYNLPSGFQLEALYPSKLPSGNQEEFL